MLVACHTHYSFRYGTLAPRVLVEKAAVLGHRVLALTDINSSSGQFEFVQACREFGVDPVTGIEFRNGDELCYVGLPFDEEGIRELHEFLTRHLFEGDPFPHRPPFLEHCCFILPFTRTCVEELREGEYLGVRPGDLRWKHRERIAEALDRCVIFHPVSFSDEEEHFTHRLLRAIDRNSLLDHLRPEAEAAPSEMLRSPDELRRLYEGFPQLERNTFRLLERCAHLDPAPPSPNRCFYTGNEADDRELLEKLGQEGMIRRYGPNDTAARERLHKELDMIERLGFCAYFLITWDIVGYGDQNGYYHVGRGSGANSIVSYCLGLTDVDPLALNLYFERFINPERSSPPDLDIDFSWDERDDVTDYVLKRFGPEYTAILCTFGSFKPRSAIRELGKVHGMPKGEIDALLDAPPEEFPSPKLRERILRHADRIADMPDHRGIHAGGILIGEHSLAYSTASFLPPKGFPVTQMDMYTAEDMGFHKFDVLSQRGIGHVKEAVRQVEANRGEQVDIRDVERLRNDPETMRSLREGRCIGCFYIESPAMRGLLQKLRCDTALGLVAASSIIRPGVAQSGMMREYILRKHDPENYEAVHPIFEEELSETYGVMVYQEDVIQVVHRFAGLGLGEADVLRKLMSGKTGGKKLDLSTLQEKFFANCRELDRDPEVAKEVWRQISSFAGYSFAKGHSASYAVGSVQSLYLKTHYPLEFYTAVINNFGGFYRTEVYVRQAMMHGARVHPPCIECSGMLCSIEGEDLYLGLILIGGLEQRTAERIVEERERNGAFGSMEALTSRVPMKREQLELLIRVGALRSTGVSRKELLWEKHRCLEGSGSAPSPKLLDTRPDTLELPELDEAPYEEAFEEWEILGFPLCSPFELLRTKQRGDVMARELAECEGQRVRIMGSFVSFKPVRTVRGERMGFAAWQDPEGSFFDTTHFPDGLRKYPLRGEGCYLIQGKVDLDFGFPSIEVERMAKLPWMADPRTEPSEEGRSGQRFTG